MKRAVAAGLGIAWLAQFSAQAGEQLERDRKLFGSLYVGQWAKTALYDLPMQAVSGRLSRADSYFAGAAINYAVIPSFAAPLPFLDEPLRGFSIEVEGRVLKHFGLQEHGEVALAILIRSPQIPLPAGLSMNVAIGEGGSYALTLPKYEGSIAAEGPMAAGPRRFLNYLPIELELSHQAWKPAHLVLAIHHRSGIWGVIAPHKTGANYLTAGLRLDF